MGILLAMRGERDEAIAAFDLGRTDDAANAAEQLRNAWAQITDGLIAEIKRIRGVMSDTPTNYAVALAAFNNASMLARSGDQEAAKALPGLSQNARRGDDEDAAGGGAARPCRSAKTDNWSTSTRAA